MYKNHCPCCGATTKDDHFLHHDELCSYNNTREALREFMPKDFILGVQNAYSKARTLEYGRIVGSSVLESIQDTALALVSRNPDVRVAKCRELATDPLFRLSPMEWGILARVVAESRPNCRMMIHNFLLFKAAYRVIRQDIRDEYFRHKARKEVIGRTFLKAFEHMLHVD